MEYVMLKYPKDVVISGNCGKGVAINYKTINGLSHTFTGNVKCLGQFWIGPSPL